MPLNIVAVLPAVSLLHYSLYDVTNHFCNLVFNALKGSRRRLAHAVKPHGLTDDEIRKNITKLEILLQRLPINGFLTRHWITYTIGRYNP